MCPKICLQNSLQKSPRRLFSDLSVVKTKTKHVFCCCSSCSLFLLGFSSSVLLIPLIHNNRRKSDKFPANSKNKLRKRLNICCRFALGFAVLPYGFSSWRPCQACMVLLRSFFAGNSNSNKT